MGTVLGIKLGLVAAEQIMHHTTVSTPKPTPTEAVIKQPLIQNQLSHGKLRHYHHLTEPGKAKHPLHRHLCNREVLDAQCVMVFIV